MAATIGELGHVAGLMSMQAALTQAASDLAGHLELDFADLDDIVRLQPPFLLGRHSASIDISAVAAVQILEHQLSLVAGDEGVLPRGPDAVSVRCRPAP